MEDVVHAVAPVGGPDGRHFKGEAGRRHPDDPPDLRRA